MANNTYIALDKATITSATQGITFTNIPQGYTDLILVLDLISKTAGNDVRVRVGNGSIDSNANYSSTHMTGDGSTAGTSRTADATYIPFYRLAGTSTNNATLTIRFQNYSNTSFAKTAIMRNGSGASETGLGIGLWRSTNAINQIYIYEDGNTAPQQFDAGTTATLYGIKAEAVTPTPKATGGAIYSDNYYFYHVFGSTAAFVPSQSLSADILVVAGGGGSGSGGAGAGGLLEFVSQSLSATSYTCTVGAGGAAGVFGTSTRGSNGGNSQFGALTLCYGGGGSGMRETQGSGASGGSGGGGGSSSVAINSGGAGTAGQGYAGSSGGSTTNGYPSGGGGGAGAAAANATSTVSASGGIGATSAFINAIGIVTGVGEYIPSLNSWYMAGGGGGGLYADYSGNGLGGYGGGGTGGLNNLGTPGKPNTGGGAGGAAGGTNGKNGGSGVIIVRYLK